MLLPTRTVLAALPAPIAARPLQRVRAAGPGADPDAKPGSLRVWELLLRTWAPEATSGAAGSGPGLVSGLGSGSGHAPVYLLERADLFLRTTGARAGDRLALAVVGGQLRIEVRVLEGFKLTAMSCGPWIALYFLEKTVGV